MAITQVNLYEAKTQLSSLVERAAKGEEIVIAKAGKPIAVLTAIRTVESASEPDPLPFGQNLLGVGFISEDWEADLPSELLDHTEEDHYYLTEVAK